MLNGQNKSFAQAPYIEHQWFHTVLIYRGPQPQDFYKIKIYHDGTLAGMGGEQGFPVPSGTGRTVIGAMHIEEPWSVYTSLAVDEVKMWNRQISEEEINNMYP